MPGRVKYPQGFANPSYLPLPQYLHDPHIRTIDFAESKATQNPLAAALLSAARGPAP
jgi:hypothetical protein